MENRGFVGKGYKKLVIDVDLGRSAEVGEYLGKGIAATWSQGALTCREILDTLVKISVTGRTALGVSVGWAGGTPVGSG